MYTETCFIYHLDVLRRTCVLTTCWLCPIDVTPVGRAEFQNKLVLIDVSSPPNVSTIYIFFLCARSNKYPYQHVQIYYARINILVTSNCMWIWLVAGQKPPQTQLIGCAIPLFLYTALLILLYQYIYINYYIYI